MKRWLVCTLVAVAVLALGVLSAVSARDSGDPDKTRNAGDHGRAFKDDRQFKEDRADGREKFDKSHRGYGPPAWAHRHGPNQDKAAREEWRKLTPEQRRDFMDKLIREHMEAMQAWGDCVAADRDDCELPLPPGLAARP
jgi:hypothetical protein